MKNPFKFKPNPAFGGAASANRLEPGTKRMPAMREAHTFGKTTNHIKPFISAALQNFTLVAPVLLIAAVIISVLAINQVAGFISAFTKEIKSVEISKLAPLVDKKPLISADYQSAANVMAKNNSAVQVSLSRTRNAILVTVKEPSLLPEFMYALTTLQSFRQGVAWNAVKLCLNKCEGGNAATAEITGYTQSIQFTGLRPN